MKKIDRWLILSAVFFTLGGAIGAIFGVIHLIKTVAPEILTSPSTSPLELPIGMVLFLLILLIGSMLGVTLYVLIWRPFVPRSKLEALVTQPYVPLITPLLNWLFEQIYPRDT